jgi:hypothetical protein
MPSLACGVPGCSSKLSSISNLRRHALNVHPSSVDIATRSDTYPIICRFCKLAHKNEHDVNIHQSKSKHCKSLQENSANSPVIPDYENVTDNRYICKYCGLVFPSKRSLAQHGRNQHIKLTSKENGNNLSPIIISVKDSTPSALNNNNNTTSPDNNSMPPDIWDLFRNLPPIADSPPSPATLANNLLDNLASSLTNLTITPTVIPVIKKPLLNLFTITEEEWIHIGTTVSELNKTIRYLPIRLYSNAEWDAFSIKVDSLVDILYSECLSARAELNGDSPQIYLEGARMSRRELRLNTRKLGYVSKLLQAGKTEEALKEFRSLPEHIKQELPLPSHSTWRSAVHKYRKKLRRASTRVTRKIHKLIKAGQKHLIAELYNSDNDKAMNKITQDTSNKDCDIEIPILSAAYENITADTKAQFPDPDWFTSITWPANPTPSEDAGTTIMPDEVLAQLKSMHRLSAPGPDAVPYLVYYKVPDMIPTLTHIYEICRINGNVPPSWNLSKTILIYKKEDPYLVKNWRPISLQNCIYKIFAAILTKRLITYGINNHLFSSSQKGFLPYKGCYEHTYVLKSAIEDSRRHRRPIYINWFDLKNAFGSISHTLLAKIMVLMKVPTYLQSIVNKLYADSKFYLVTAKGVSPFIPMRRGTRQGCPLSPLLFNLVLEPLLRWLSLNPGYSFSTTPLVSVSIQAFADDLATLAGSRDELSDLFKKCYQFMRWADVEFGVDKCAVYTMEYFNGRIAVPTVKLSINDKVIPHSDINELYKYLGTEVGFGRNKLQVNRVFKNALDLAVKITSSDLEPWQKIHAIKSFVLSKCIFICYNSNPNSKLCKDFDSAIRKKIRTILNLPQNVSKPFYYTPVSKGGLGLHRVNSYKKAAQVSLALSILSSPDPFLRDLAHYQIQDVALARKIVIDPSANTFFNWKLCNYVPVTDDNSSDLSSLWIRCLPILEKFKIKIYEDQGDILVKVGSNEPAPAETFSNSIFRTILQLKSSSLVESWKNYRSQGRIMSYLVDSPLRNTMIRNSAGLTAPEYKFMFKCQLSLLPTLVVRNRYNSALPTVCRLCNAHIETQNHILGHCNGVKPEITNRHHDICRYLAKEVKSNWSDFRLDKQADGSTLRPDLQMSDLQRQIYNVIEVAVCYEDYFSSSIDTIKNIKLNKYADLMSSIADKGFETTLLPFVMGQCGSYQEGLPKALSTVAGVPIKKAKSIIAKCATLCVKGSYKVWRRWTECVLPSNNM